MATNTSDFFTYSATAGTAKNLQKPQDGGDNNQWGNFINVDLDEIVAAVNALSDKIADANEKTLVDFTATGSAVNHVGITNAATGNPPQISSAGSDTNVDLTLTAKGTGDINLTPGTNGDVNIPANKGITFGDDGEVIEGDGTDLTVASSGALNLSATTDVVVPADVGITFGTGEKIQGDNTNLTLTSGADINLTATSDVNLPNDVGLVFGDDGEKIKGDGTDLTIASSGEININSGTLDLSAQTVDVNLNSAVDALNFVNALSIDASNNRIGITTNTPGEALHIKTTADADYGIKVENDDTQAFCKVQASGNALYGGNAGVNIVSGGSFVTAMHINSSGNIGINTSSFTGTASGRKVLELNGDGGAGALLNLSVGGTRQAYLFHDTSNMYLYNVQNNDLIFGTNNTETMRIGSSGHVYMYSLNTTSSFAANMYVHSDGQVFKVTSSRRFKTNIVDTAKGLLELLKLRPVDYNSNLPSDDSSKLCTGLIAEEVAEAGFHEYVTRDSENVIESVSYPSMVTLCIKAIQELSAKVTALENA